MESRSEFQDYLRSRGYDPETMRDFLSYLDRFIVSIETPEDVIRVFAPLSEGQKHHLIKALRAWFKYLELSGRAERSFLDALRGAIPKDPIGIDVAVPEEARILSDLKRCQELDPRYGAVFNLLLESGLRLAEAVWVANSHGEGAEVVNGFVRQPLSLFRGGKRAFYAYYSQETLKRISESPRVNYRAVSAYLKKHGFTAPKYIRKFVFDRMLSLGIPESVADFIEGRVAKSIGARHYTQLMRQADMHYQKYADYLSGLRFQALGSRPQNPGPKGNYDSHFPNHCDPTLPPPLGEVGGQKAKTVT
jgi:intergrase/recombinase